MFHDNKWQLVWYFMSTGKNKRQNKKRPHIKVNEVFFTIFIIKTVIEWYDNILIKVKVY